MISRLLRRSRLNRVSNDAAAPLPRDERNIKLILEAAAQASGSTESAA